MKKMIITVVLIGVVIMILSACGNTQGTSSSMEDSEKTDINTGGESDLSIPQELTEIPENYNSVALKQGTLVDLYYDTYESFSYEKQTQSIKKHAIVYLPYGYDGNQDYNIVYLMHGGGGTEQRTLGSVSTPSIFKNVIDNGIQEGKIKPMIIVCPTYNNTNQNGLDSNSFNLAMQLTENYHNELANDLIPAVESTYNTYAQSTSVGDLAASRDHRAFVGFSMGSVTTWRTFEYCLDYFHYFIPMSCGTTLDDERIFASAEGYNQEDYFVWIMTGTDDFAYSYDENRVEKMRSSKYFTESNHQSDGNFAYRVKEGYSHDLAAEAEYTYNGLMWLWNGEPAAVSESETSAEKNTAGAYEKVNENTSINDIINDPLFEGYGRLLFPVDDGYYSGNTLDDLSLTWYGHPDTEESVEIINKLKENAASGKRVFYDIYTDEEKAADPRKKETGLFFFRGEPGAKFAVCNAGGGWAYVGAMQDSFPHALELSKKGYNAFAVIYRPGEQTACEDLARAISFIYEHAAELKVDTSYYSLWGGSAGARMAARLGSRGTEYYGGDSGIPKPAAVIMQYTSYTDVSNDPPTYNCVGTNDGIAPYRMMASRIEKIKAQGTAAEIEIFEGLSHGFGLGIGTVAEGWLDHAVVFWEKQMNG